MKEVHYLNDFYPLIKWVKKHLRRGRLTWFESNELKDLIEKNYFEN